MLHQCKICCLSAAIWRGQLRAPMVNEGITRVTFSFFAGCTKGGCNVTTLAWGPNANNISPRWLVVENKRFSVKLGIILVRKSAAWRLCCLGPPRHRGLYSCRNWSRENQLCCEEWSLERLEEEKKKGGGAGLEASGVVLVLVVVVVGRSVVVFSCMQPDP